MSSDFPVQLIQNWSNTPHTRKFRSPDPSTNDAHYKSLDNLTPEDRQSMKTDIG